MVKRMDLDWNSLRLGFLIQLLWELNKSTVIKHLARGLDLGKNFIPDGDVEHTLSMWCWNSDSHRQRAPLAEDGGAALQGRLSSLSALAPLTWIENTFTQLTSFTQVIGWDLCFSTILFLPTPIYQVSHFSWILPITAGNPCCAKWVFYLGVSFDQNSPKLLALEGNTVAVSTIHQFLTPPQSPVGYPETGWLFQYLGHGEDGNKER